MAKNAKKNSTKDASEIAQFDRLGDEWWDEEGAMKPLHALNPTRMEYIKTQICRHTGKNAGDHVALKGLSIADIGCGGGLVTEPLARMGATVTGIDAGKENLKVAKTHAEKQGLNITYLHTTSEEVVETGASYDVVTALEIIEHVADTDLFIQSCCRLVKPGGMIIFSTLNRTAKSYLLGIVAAERILRWLPVGTHDWKKFMKPSEIAKPLQKNGFQVKDISGLVYHPLSDDFSLSKHDLGVNYFLTAVRK